LTPCPEERENGFEDVGGCGDVACAVAHQAVEPFPDFIHRPFDKNVSLLFGQRTFFAIQLKAMRSFKIQK
jgi:hypothetical protein